MLSDYRAWLESELKLLGNASHHAYSFGQANMAKRAIERFDEEVRGKVLLALEPAEAEAVLAALEPGPLRERVAASIAAGEVPPA
jgi:hypothetical protein